MELEMLPAGCAPSAKAWASSPQVGRGLNWDSTITRPMSLGMPRKMSLGIGRPTMSHRSGKQMSLSHRYGKQMSLSQIEQKYHTLLVVECPSLLVENMPRANGWFSSTLEANVPRCTVIGWKQMEHDAGRERSLALVG